MSTETPLVSVIIPVYNTEPYLEACVGSVLKQTHRNVEVVLVDDGSTDSSASLCDKFAEIDARVVVIHQSNSGVSEARNVGLRHASGDWVFFLDSDDWLAPECLEVLRGLLINFNAQVASCGTVKVVGAGDTSEGVDLSDSYAVSGNEFLRHPMLHAPVHPVSVCAKLIERSLLNGFEFPSGRLHEDVAVTHVILHRATRIALTPRPMHFYRQRPGSITAGTMSLKSASDKARAHLEKARGLHAFGLSEVAALEFRRGLGWHLRTAAAISKQGRSSSTISLTREIAAQRTLLSHTQGRPVLNIRTRLALATYLRAPGVVPTLYVGALQLFSKRVGPHHRIEGELNNNA